MPFAQWGYHPELGRGIEAFETAVPGRLHLRGDRPDPRLVLHADGRRRAAFRRDGVPQRRLPRAHRRRRRPQDVEVARQRSIRGRPSTARAPTPCAGGCSRAAPPGRHARSATRSSTRRVRQFLLPLWNVYSFFVTTRTPMGSIPMPSRRRRGPPAVLDRWILSQLAGTVRDVRDGMDAYDATGAGRRIQRLVDDLSTWYVRRWRRRFWNPGGAAGPTRAPRSTRCTSVW